MVEYYNYNDRWSFIGTWFEKEVGFFKNFIIKFYPLDNSVEIYDRDLNRMYLKRTIVEDLSNENLLVGNSVTIYGRQIKITGYSDGRTKNYFEKLGEKAFLLLKPNVIHKLGEIIHRIQERKFLVTKLRMYLLSKIEASEFYAKLKGDVSHHVIVANVTSGPTVALELQGEKALERITSFLGPSDPDEAKKVAPTSLTALYGIDKIANGFHGAATPADVIYETNFFFSEQQDTPTPLFQVEKTTCCIIKPHAIKEENLGPIIISISEAGFVIAGAKMMYLTRSDAEVLLEVYKGLVNDYNDFIVSYIGGPCVALVVASKNSNMDVHGEFRKFAGPSDPEKARLIRPNSLRAKYGCKEYNNAIHCTDAPEDTCLEIEYLFRTLKKD